MARTASILILTLLVLTSQGYFHPAKCFQDTVALEKKLLEMSLHFASLAYFSRGLEDMKMAWKLVPSWLINCVPFIIQPKNLDYDFSDISITEENSVFYLNGQEIFTKSSEPQSFEICRQAVDFSIRTIENVTNQAKNQDYEGVVRSLADLGSIYEEFQEVCHKN